MNIHLILVVMTMDPILWLADCSDVTVTIYKYVHVIVVICRVASRLLYVVVIVSALLINNY